ncbi:hypothetical protein OAG71_04060 [bacterium]|nr:hypothetical protein [bacterium]
MHDSSPAINPFAAPVTSSIRENSEENARASEIVLRRLCRRLAITDICYTLGCASFFATFFSFSVFSTFGGNRELYMLLSYLPFLFFAVTGIYLFNVHRVVRGWVGAVGVLIAFLFPLFGTLVFRAESVHANMFLRHNGYQRTFLGGKPDPEERKRMEVDSNYIPSAYFDKQGKRRSRSVFTLSDATIVAMLGFIFVMMILI